MATVTDSTVNTSAAPKVELKSPTNRDFLRIYVPLARSEKTAKEIAEAFNKEGFEMDSDGVSTKAAQLRAKFKRDGVEESKIKNAVPTLKREGRKGESSDELLGFVDDLINAAGAEEKAPEAPEVPQGNGNKGQKGKK